MIIVDTNVVVTGLITSNASTATARLLNAMVSGRTKALVSPALLDAYRAVLLRPKINALHGFSADQIDHLLRAIFQPAMWHEPPFFDQGAPDPGDNHLWRLLAAEPRATLVTGDLRLMDAPPFEDRVIRIQDYESFVK